MKTSIKILLILVAIISFCHTDTIPCPSKDCDKSFIKYVHLHEGKITYSRTYIENEVMPGFGCYLRDGEDSCKVHFIIKKKDCIAHTEMEYISIALSNEAAYQQ